MFTNFCIQNFLSIKDEHCLDFRITKSQHVDDTSIERNNFFLNKIACLVGPNASGKTNVLKAFVAFTLFVEHSYLTKDIAIEPHFFQKNKDIIFSAEFIECNGDQFYYTISLNKNDQNQIQISSEQLRRLNPDTKYYNNIFTREKDNFQSDIIKLNEADKGRLGSSVTAFSFLQKLNYLIKAGIEIKSFSSILTNVNTSSTMHLPTPQLMFIDQLTRELEKRPDLLASVVEEVQKVDLGISNLTPFTVKPNNNLQPQPDLKLLLAEHKDGHSTVRLPLLQESAGTVNYIILFAKIRDILTTGGILIADELENSLHTDLVERILTLFIRKESNPNNAQIVFSTHNPWFLQFLRKTQIFIVEKDHAQATDMYRLDEIKEVRNDENYFIKYINGEYDGRPKIKEYL